MPTTETLTLAPAPGWRMKSQPEAALFSESSTPLVLAIPAVPGERVAAVVLDVADRQRGGASEAAPALEAAILVVGASGWGTWPISRIAQIPTGDRQALRLELLGDPQAGEALQLEVRVSTHDRIGYVYAATAEYEPVTP